MNTASRGRQPLYEPGHTTSHLRPHAAPTHWPARSPCGGQPYRPPPLTPTTSKRGQSEPALGFGRVLGFETPAERIRRHQDETRGLGLPNAPQDNPTPFSRCVPLARRRTCTVPVLGARASSSIWAGSTHPDTTLAASSPGNNRMTQPVDQCGGTSSSPPYDRPNEQARPPPRPERGAQRAAQISAWPAEACETMLVPRVAIELR